MRTIGLIDAAMVAVAMLDTPVGRGHPRSNSHVDIEQQVEPPLAREGPVNMQVQEVIRVAEDREYQKHARKTVVLRDSVPEWT